MTSPQLRQVKQEMMPEEPVDLCRPPPHLLDSPALGRRQRVGRSADFSDLNCSPTSLSLNAQSFAAASESVM